MSLAKLVLPILPVVLIGTAAGAGAPLPRIQQFTGHPLKPPIYAMRTPAQVTGALYADLSGILLAKVRTSPPLWQQTLSKRTALLHRRLAMLDEAKGRSSFDYDWLCQCRDVRRVYAVPEVVVEKISAKAAWLRVTVHLNTGEFLPMELHYVNENGWKLDDIVDPSGQRLKQALAASILRHEGAGETLPSGRRGSKSDSAELRDLLGETIVP